MKNDDIYKIYGENFKKYRINYNFTQEEVAQITKLEAKYISQIERGVRAGTIATMLKFCLGYCVSPNDLFDNIIDIPNNEESLNMFNERFSKLNDRDKKLIIDLMNGMLNNEK